VARTAKSAERVGVIALRDIGASVMGPIQGGDNHFGGATIWKRGGANFSQIAKWRARDIA
jgi:hypothetical protein